MLTIGLTGGIASGKSSVARLLAARGAVVVDADRLAHETYAPGTPGFDAIVQAFGPGVVSPGGAIDRRALGRLVFGRPDRLERLTGIVWPLARARVEQARAAAAAAHAPAFVVEAVAFREAGWRDLVDELWLVRVPRALARQRLLQRGGLSEAEADARLDAQAATDLGEQDADRVIDNAGDLAALEAAVEAAWQAALATPG